MLIFYAVEVLTSTRKRSHQRGGRRFLQNYTISGIPTLYTERANAITAAKSWRINCKLHLDKKEYFNNRNVRVVKILASIDDPI